VAGPVFREVGTWALNNLRINPEVRMAEVMEKPKPDEGVRSRSDQEETPRREDSELLPDFRGQTMREVMKRGSALGLKVILEGTGLAFQQSPGPGSSIKGTTLVKVSFKPPA
jgi:hypothetical protein